MRVASTLAAHHHSANEGVTNGNKGARLLCEDGGGRKCQGKEKGEQHEDASGEEKERKGR
jgi:hypothetical protein